MLRSCTRFNHPKMLLEAGSESFLFLSVCDFEYSSLPSRTEYRALEGFVFAVSPFNFTAIGGNLVASMSAIFRISILSNNINYSSCPGWEYRRLEALPCSYLLQLYNLQDLRRSRCTPRCHPVYPRTSCRGRRAGHLAPKLRSSALHRQHFHIQETLEGYRCEH